MSPTPRIGVVVAARSGSTRLPGKALLPLRGQPMLLFLLRRINTMRLAEVTLATTSLTADDALADLARRENVPVIRGPVDDVVARYVLVAEKLKLDYVVRVTADCPFLDATLLDYCVEHALKHRPFNLATTKQIFPVGLDCEIYPAALMTRLHREAQLDAAEREHLTLRFYNQPRVHKILRIPVPDAWLSRAVLTVDTWQDYERAAALAQALPSTNADMDTVLYTHARLFGVKNAH